MNSDLPAAWIQYDKGKWRHFTHFAAVFCAFSPAEVMPLLWEVDKAWRAGWHIVGFLSYEAAPACDPALVAHGPGNLPLAWFGLARSPQPADTPTAAPFLSARHWQANISAQEYEAAVSRIRSYIAQGDTYQVNFTFRLRASPAYEAWPFFLHLCRAQPTAFNGYLDLSDHAICCASPELFFHLQGDEIICQPMKGTARRGRWYEEDEEQGQRLRLSTKNRAENAMIVDMVRHDLGRIAALGSVRVKEAFAVARLPTVWQMTSTISAATSAPFPEIMAALFPCASVTGAPKVRTMQIIREVEKEPRGIYCGCFGFLAPERCARFAVTIRTAHIDRGRNLMEYGVGSGVVWDSSPAEEYRECLDKALTLSSALPDFSLLETILWRPGRGYFLLEAHLRRLRASAAYFGFAIDTEAIARLLAERAATFPPQRHRVRLLLAQDGAIHIEDALLPVERPRRPWRIALAAQPIDAENRWLYHKTTWRHMYEEARQSHPAADDVILWNQHEEITEGTMANVVVRLEGRLLTPALGCGLLPGIFRQRLLERGMVREAVITKAEILRCEAIWLVNSVRGWLPTAWLETT